MHDLVIRDDLVVDATGASPREADVAVDGARITAVKKSAARARRELDARGLLVTPGLVDVHTHYDGQLTWDRSTFRACTFTRPRWCSTCPPRAAV